MTNRISSSKSSLQLSRRQCLLGQYAPLTMQVNEDTLEDVLLFVGILSGRGYRHRRLAVREAWANQCQKPGVSVVPLHALRG